MNVRVFTLFENHINRVSHHSTLSSTVTNTYSNLETRMLRRSAFSLVRRTFADKPIVKKTRAQIVIEKTPVGKIDQVL